jgi:GNAT superfamily N-acetyltransferase
MMRFIEYRPEFKEECLALLRSNVPGFLPDSQLQRYEAFLQNRDCPYYVLQDADGQVIAAVGYSWTPGSATARLCWGLVREDERGHGYGHFGIMSVLEKICQLDGVEWVQSSVSQQAVGFSERMGFEATGMEQHGIGPGYHRIHVRLPLDRAKRAEIHDALTAMRLRELNPDALEEALVIEPAASETRIDASTLGCPAGDAEPGE